MELAIHKEIKRVSSRPAGDTVYQSDDDRPPHAKVIYNRQRW